MSWDEDREALAEIVRQYHVKSGVERIQQNGETSMFQ